MKQSIIILILAGIVSCKPKTSAQLADTATQKDTITQKDIVTQKNTAIPQGTTILQDTTPQGTATPTADTTASYLIIPGKSIGNTRIDENMDDVYKLLGKPDDGDAAMQKAVAVYYRNHEPGSYATSILSERGTDEHPIAKVKQIRITSPAFKTAEGVHVGSGIAGMQLKKVSTYTDKGVVYTVWDGGNGIAFETDAKKQCIAITVYPAGESYKEAYLNIRPSHGR